MNANTEGSNALLNALRKAVAEQQVQVQFLSGGIDSAFLATLDPKVPAVTVGIENDGIDLQFAKEVAEYLHLVWHPVRVTHDDSLRALYELVVLTRSFDIGLLNDIPLYFAMKYALAQGWQIARTGDVADTLFCGYSYLQEDGFDIQMYLHNLIPHIKVQSGILGRLMGMQIHHPYLHPEVVDIAQRMQLSDNVAKLPLGQSGDFYTRNSTGSTEGLYTWGKVSLRKAAQGLLPERILWRVKTDLMFGSGTHTLEKSLSQGICEQDLYRLQVGRKHFWNLAHVKLYLWYERARLSPRPPVQGEYRCQWCGAGNIQGRGHCFTCGGYPAEVEPQAFLVG